MGYYAIWLASVKRIFGSVLGIGRRKSEVGVPPIGTENSKPAAHNPKAAAPGAGLKVGSETLLDRSTSNKSGVEYGRLRERTCCDASLAKAQKRGQGTPCKFPREVPVWPGYRKQRLDM
jgi:hypothetical protein